MDNQFAMMLIQSVLADPEGRAGVVETATNFLESLGVYHVELTGTAGDIESGTPEQIVSLLVDAIAERLETPAVVDVEFEVEGVENV